MSFGFNKNKVHVKAKIKFSNSENTMNVKGKPYFDNFIGREDQKIIMNLSGDPNIDALRMNVYNGKNPIEFLDFTIPASGKPTYYLIVEDIKTGENELIYGHLDDNIFERLLETAKFNDLEEDRTKGDLYKKINNIWAKSKNTVEEFKNNSMDYTGNTSSESMSNATDKNSSVSILSYSYNDKLEWIRLIKDLKDAGYNGVDPDDYNLPSSILKGSNLDIANNPSDWHHLPKDNYTLSAYVFDMVGAISVNFFLSDLDKYWGEWSGDQIEYNFQIGLNNTSANGNVHAVYDESKGKLIYSSNKGLYLSHMKAGLGKVNGDSSQSHDKNVINEQRTLIIARTDADDNSTANSIWNNIKPLAGLVPYGNYASAVFDYLIDAPGTVSNSYNIHSYGPDYLYQTNNYDEMQINAVGDSGSYVLSKQGDKVRVEVDIDTYNTYTGTVYWQYSYTGHYWD